MDSFWDDFWAYIRSYLPQWRYDPDSGEPESAVLLAAAELIQESRARLAQLPLKHEAEFLRGWPLEALEADPMCAFGALTAPEGERAGAGKEFYLSGDGARLWRTVEDTQAEPAQLMQQFLTGNGKWIALPLPTPEQPVRLFDIRGEGVPGPELQFAHPDAFASQGGCQAALRFPKAAAQLLEILGSGQTHWALVCESGETAALETPVRVETALWFQLPAAPDGLAVRANLPSQLPAVDCIGTVTVSARRLSQPPELVWDGEGFCTGERWLPFGGTPEIWQTCCVSCSDALRLRGARLTVSFVRSFQTHEELLPGMEQPPEYRPIMRRLPTQPPSIQDVWADQVLWEYWSENAWLPVPGTDQYTGCFAVEEPGPAPIKAEFIWPEDAALCEAGGKTGFWLRWRVARRTGGGWLPRRCHAPEVTQLQISAVLEDSPVAISVRDRLESDFRPLNRPDRPLFQARGPEGDCWWLGFDRPPSGRLLRLYLSLQNRVPGGKLTAWESTGDGRERQLFLEDGTDGLSHSGVVSIHVTQGGLDDRFGLRLWWLCLRDESGRLSQGRQFPRLEGLFCGAVCLQSENSGLCQKDEPLSPLRGGALQGVMLTESFGGAEAEDRAAFFARARALRHHQGRCVSALDVDQLLCGSLRDILRTRCLRAEDTLYVAVLMRDVKHHEAAFFQRQETIRRLLERDSALPTLGWKVVVREPVFYTIMSAVWLRSNQDIPIEAMQRMVCGALDQFLHPAAGHFQGSGWQIGRMPTELETRNYLQAQLPGMVLVKLLLTAVAPDGREKECALVDDPFALPLPGLHTIHLLRGEELSCTNTV